MTRGMATIRDSVNRLGSVVSMAFRADGQDPTQRSRRCSTASLALSMEMIINLFCDDFTDAGDAFEVGEAGGRDGARRPEMVQQGALAHGADASDLVKRRSADGPRPLAAMGADGET